MQRHNKRKQRAQHAPASSAGEAIERMLVEKKISSKLNYDVLRDLDAGFSGDSNSDASMLDSTQPLGGLGFGDPSSSGLTGMASVADGTDQFSHSSSSLEVARASPSGVGRLPSLRATKRSFSSLGGGSVSGRLPKQVQNLNSGFRDGGYIIHCTC